jgi:hypothetical protein
MSIYLLIYRNDEFRKKAFVYYDTHQKAQNIIKYVNLRYVKNKQLFISFADRYYDIVDFRTRIELDVKLENKELEMLLFKKQRDRLELELTNKKRLNDEDNLKLEYLTKRYRQIEYSLGLSDSQKLII